MTNVHESVGWLTVTGRSLLGIADSIDAGNVPDVLTPAANVTIKASIDRVVVIADKTILNFPPDGITASLDAEGRLVAPADGIGVVGTSTNITLVAPDQSTISHVGWRWEITVRPADGKAFTPYEVYITGAPGQEKSIGDAILSGDVPSLSIQPSTIAVAGTGTDDALTLDDIPDGTPSGTLVVNTAVTPPTVSLYR